MSGPTHGPFTVERHDNDDGSIAYEIWTHGMERRILRVRDDDNTNAKADVELIAYLLNNQAPVHSPACDCGATTDGKWADTHSKGCAALSKGERR